MADAIRETLAFTDLSPEEKQKRGILGRLYGPTADIINPTRNGRKYSDEVWEKVFNDKDSIASELLANGGIPGELDHPADRDDIDTSKVAIMMPEAPKKDKDGHLVSYFDILDTPNGRIAYELEKYGFNLGVSSRGNGDVDESTEEVDPDTYDFKCFDLVLVPSVKDARLKMVEGLDSKNTGLKKALREALDKSKPDERKIMEKTLEDLNIEVKDEKVLLKESIDEVDNYIKTNLQEDKKSYEDSIRDGFLHYRADHFKGKPGEKPSEEEIQAFIKAFEDVFPPKEDVNTSDKEVKNKADEVKVESDAPKAAPAKIEEASNAGSEDLVKSLQEALKSKAESDAKIQSLQEQLAVSNTKVSDLEEEAEKFKSATVRLSSIANEKKALQTQVASLEESIKAKDKSINTQKSFIAQLNESKKQSDSKSTTLNESISGKDSKIASLNESLTKQKESYESQIKKLNEDLATVRTSSTKQVGELQSQITKTLKLKESYKKLANDTVNSYIEAKATMIDVTPDEIKNRLKESYTLKDIDAVCDGLQEYALNINKLPFSFDRKVKVQAKASVNENLSIPNPYDDEVDDLTLAAAGINK